jgi:NADPH:quinone reductase-like Zn-dependent oxidoreductase
MLVGRGVTEWSRGDRVVAISGSMGRTRSGAYADYLAVSSRDLHAIPENVSFLGAVSVGRAFATAWSALFEDGRLGMDERAVVIGAAHSIGIAAVQICRWRDSTVMAVANGRHAPRLGALGATRTISQSAPDLTGHVIAGLGARSATIVLNVTGELLSESLQMLDRNGRLVLTGGGDPQPLDLDVLVDRQAHVMGSSTRVDKVDMHHILKLLSEGTFLPVIDSIYPLSQAARAHQRAESQQVFGAVGLVPDHLYQSTEKITQLHKEG